MYPEINKDLPVVAIDFDGVLAESTWPSPELGRSIEDGVKMLLWYQDHGAEIVILTSRPPSHFPQIWEWLDRHGLRGRVYDITNTKIRAGIYIDDRAVRFPLDYYVKPDPDPPLDPAKNLEAHETHMSPEQEAGFTGTFDELAESRYQSIPWREFQEPKKSLYDPESEPNAARIEQRVDDLFGRIAPAPTNKEIRQFDTGATRNLEVDPDYHGFFSPLAMHAYGEYMHAHRLQSDGTMRESDNWQKGMPIDTYVRSLVRHVHDVQLEYDGWDGLVREDAHEPSALRAHLSAIIFNAQAWLHEIMKED